MNPVDGSMNPPLLLPDEPLFEEVDEALEKERTDLNVRHTKELDELDLNKKRDALVRKHAEERAAFRAKVETATTKKRQDRDNANLKARQEAEDKAFKDRPPVVVRFPTDANEADLKARHEAEAKKMAEDHEAEEKALKDKNTPPAPATPGHATSISDTYPKPPAPDTRSEAEEAARRQQQPQVAPYEPPQVAPYVPPVPTPYVAPDDTMSGKF
jgi:hypothetical protein